MRRFLDNAPSPPPEKTELQSPFHNSHQNAPLSFLRLHIAAQLNGALNCSRGAAG